MVQNNETLLFIALYVVYWFIRPKKDQIQNQDDEHNECHKLILVCGQLDLKYMATSVS